MDVFCCVHRHFSTASTVIAKDYNNNHCYENSKRKNSIYKITYGFSHVISPQQRLNDFRWGGRPSPAFEMIMRGQ